MVLVNSYKRVGFWWLNAADEISHSSLISSDYGSISFSEVDYDANEMRDDYTRWGSESGVYSLSSTGRAEWYGTATLTASASVST